MNVLAASIGFLSVGLTAVLVAVMSTSGGLERGGVVGIRTRATTSSDAAWAESHRVARPLLMSAGWSALAFAALLVAWEVADLSPRIAAVLAAAGLVEVLTLTIWGAVKGHHAALRVSTT